MTTGEPRDSLRQAGGAYLTLGGSVAEALEAKQGIRTIAPIARRLPAELACRFHALPIAEENGRITVAMVDPEDVIACEIIARALSGNPSHEKASPLVARESANPEQPESAQANVVQTRHAPPSGSDIPSSGSPGHSPMRASTKHATSSADLSNSERLYAQPSQPREMCAVRGEPDLIDALLAEIWGQEPADEGGVQAQRLNLVVRGGRDTSNRFVTYARELADLLGAELSWTAASVDLPHLVLLDQGPSANNLTIGRTPTSVPEGQTLPATASNLRLPVAAQIEEAAAHGKPGTDPVRSSTPSGKSDRADNPRFGQELSLRNCCESDEPSPSVLLVRDTRWPLRRLLLIMRPPSPSLRHAQGGPQASDEAALTWATRLARASGAQVTILAIVPFTPAMYSGLRRLRNDLADLLRSDTPLGQRLRVAAQWLVRWQVKGTLRLREGVPEVEAMREVLEGDYDLVIIGADQSHQGVRGLVADFVEGLTHVCDRSLLIAHPIPVSILP